MVYSILNERPSSAVPNLDFNNSKKNVPGWRIGSTVAIEFNRMLVQYGSGFSDGWIRGPFQTWTETLTKG